MYRIILTYKYHRDIFLGDEFKDWVKKFYSVKFEGFESGMSYPEISISLNEFETKKELLKEDNLVRVRSDFPKNKDVLQHLCFPVNHFDNDLRKSKKKATN